MGKRIVAGADGKPREVSITTARECPEGLAMKWGRAIQLVQLSNTFGLPDGEPWNRQSAPFMQAVAHLRGL